MAKKLKEMAEAREGKADLNQLASAIRDSAQQIWLAGLGAFSKAQDEGSKVFETLVKEGLNIQRRTRSATEEKLGAVTGKVSKAAGDITRQATQSWDKLEQVFEDRVARALTRLGVPSGREIEALLARVDALNESVQALNGAAPKRPARASAVAQGASRARASRSNAAGAARSGAKPAGKAAAKPAAKPAAKSAAKPAARSPTPRRAAVRADAAPAVKTGA